MVSRAATGVIVFILSLELRLCQGTCPSPQPGKCSMDNYTIDSNEEHDLSAGNCDFTHSSDLCCYQQGCADPEMSNWTLQEGMARSRQIRGGNCSSHHYYSVLESPWLNKQSVACLKFTYRREPPAALDVFLETRGGQIKTVLSRTHNSAENQTTDVQWNVTDATVKVILRAYGGGCCQPVYIYKVFVSAGWCTLPDIFEKNTSLPLSPTEQGTVDCLQFTYQLPNSTGSRLTVSVQPLDDNTAVTVWEDAVSSGQNLTGQCPLQVHAPYKIIFEEDKFGSSGGFSWKVTQFRRSIRAEDCPPSPTGANTTDSNTVVTSSIESQSSSGQCHHSSHPDSTGTKISTSPTASTSPQRTTGVPPDTASQSTASETPEKTPEDQKESDVAAIGGGVAAAVIVTIIAVVIIVIVVRRRRRLNRDGDKGTTMAVDTERGSTPDDVVTPSIYDSPGELSPPNPYGRLQATTPNVSAATATSAAPSADISMTESASYYNVGCNGKSAVSSYQNIGDPVTSANDDDEINYYEQM